MYVIAAFVGNDLWSFRGRHTGRLYRYVKYI